MTDKRTLAPLAPLVSAHEGLVGFQLQRVKDATRHDFPLRSERHLQISDRQSHSGGHRNSALGIAGGGGSWAAGNVDVSDAQALGGRTPWGGLKPHEGQPLDGGMPSWSWRDGRPPLVAYDARRLCWRQTADLASHERQKCFRVPILGRSRHGPWGEVRGDLVVLLELECGIVKSCPKDGAGWACHAPLAAAP